MRDPSSLRKNFINKYADYQYTTFDKRMRVWVWHQVILVEVAGIWTPEVVSLYLRSLFNDLSNIRRVCRQIFAIIDCSQLKIQNEAFRDRLKMDWEMFFKRDDLMIYLVDDNPLRLIIRQSIMKLVSGKKNVRMFKELNAAVWSVLIQMMLEETDVRR